MKTKTILYVAAVAFAGAGLGSAWFGLREANAVNANAAALLRKQSLLNANLQRAEDRMVSVTHNNKQVNSHPPTPQPAPRPPSNPANALAQERALLASNPRLRDLKAKALLSGVSQRFGLFYRLAGLSDDQIEKFEALVAGHEQAGASEPLSPRDVQFQSDEQELLGSGAYQQLQEYIRGQRALEIVRLSAWYAQPIEAYSSDQAAQLMRIIANASTSFQQGGNVGPIEWSQVLPIAATVLSPTQMDSLNVLANGSLLAQQTNARTSQQPAK